MACPNYVKECQDLAEQYPTEFKNAHSGNEHTEDFVRIVAAHLHAMDSDVGLNGKRGNPNDISDDALNILDPDDGPGTTPEGDKCWVVDFIAAAGAPNASITWNPLPDAEGSTGAWVEPGAPPDDGDRGMTYPYPDEPTTVRAYQDRIQATYAEAGRQFPDPNDSDAFRWFTRYGYDCMTMPEPDSANRHVAELRTELGLPSAK